MKKYELQVLIRALKITAGTVISIIIAQWFGLDNSSSAGIVALLTILPTRQKTFQLVGIRLVSFFITFGLAVIAKTYIPWTMFQFALMLFLICFFVYLVKWDLTLSVNAVIGTHFFLAENALTIGLVLNEAYLVIIGTSVATLVNLMMIDKEKFLKNEMSFVEGQLKILIQSMALHLLQFSQLTIDKRNIKLLIDRLDAAIEESFAYKENIFHEKSDYYIEYFRMRKNQCIEFLHIYREITSLPSLDVISEQIEIIVELLKIAARQISIENSPELMLSEIAKAEDKLDSFPLAQNLSAEKVNFTLYHLVSELKENELLKKRFIEENSAV